MADGDLLLSPDDQDHFPRKKWLPWKGELYGIISCRGPSFPQILPTPSSSPKSPVISQLRSGNPTQHSNNYTALAFKSSQSHLQRENLKFSLNCSLGEIQLATLPGFGRSELWNAFHSFNKREHCTISTSRKKEKERRIILTILDEIRKSYYLILEP